MSAPVFEPGQLVELESIVETAKELAIQAERNAEVLRRLATDLSNSLKRADQMNRPHTQPRQQTRVDGRPTPSAKGPQKILQTLRDAPLHRMTFYSLQAVTGFADSTLRTYLPCLREDGCITYGGADDKICLTDKGRTLKGKPFEFTGV
jgi:hypothetical protein